MTWPTQKMFQPEEKIYHTLLKNHPLKRNKTFLHPLEKNNFLLKGKTLILTLKNLPGLSEIKKIFPKNDFLHLFCIFCKKGSGV